MALHRFRGATALVSSFLLLGVLLVSGCGRTPANPLGPDEPEPGPQEPAPSEAPGEPALPLPAPFPPGGAQPAPPAPVAPKPPASGNPRPALRPLPKPTSTPPVKAGAGAPAPDPGAQMGEFIELLGRFGYDPGARDIQNVRMQVAVVNRVPAARFHWVESPTLGLTYGKRVKDFPKPISYQQWKADGLELARRNQGIAYYVGRRALYRDILRDRYNDTGSDAELVFYKRLVRTQFFVSYRADGQIDDYGYFPVDDWRNFLPVPGAFWQ
ncbi:MAG: hypothetical protein VKP62_01755 [Candidatus Sericytochromatia bacterium]|nr:hypothetical protein [Candidatus Sericytochromatia bacterium]